MKKALYLAPVALLLLAATVPAHAQLGGCTDSPENPTAILGIALSAASIGFVQLRNRFGSRKK